MFFENKTELSLSEKRALILHVLYSLEMTDYERSAYEIIRDYGKEYEIFIDFDDPIISDIENIILNKDSIDEELRPYLKKWNYDRVSTMVKLILRYAVWEFKNKKTDPALIINEAVELSKGFAEKESFRFVNGVLDIWMKDNNR